MRHSGDRDDKNLVHRFIKYPVVTNTNPPRVSFTY